nr:DNA-directed RNA polymerase subunit beta [Deltaproteobacteria bacterium]
MGYLDYSNRIKRVNFSKIRTVLENPHLIKLQKESYWNFLQSEVKPSERKNIGLQAAFRSVFPIADPNGRAQLDFISYAIDEPKYSEDECRERGMTYAAPMKVRFQLVLFDIDETTGNKTIRDVKEQEVFFGEIPLMTEKGTFIVNGTERVIVSQVQRSPGVYFEKDKSRGGITEKTSYSSRIIPNNGSWLDFEFDHKDALFVKIDRKKKFPIAVFLRALGYSMEEALKEFYKVEHVTIKGDTFEKKLNLFDMVGKRSPVEIRNPKTKEIIVRKGQKVQRLRAERYGAIDLGKVELPLETLWGQVCVREVVDTQSGEVIIESGKPIGDDDLEQLKSKGIHELEVCTVVNADKCVWEDLWQNKTKDRESALKEIYKKMRPTDPPTLDAAEHLF